MGRKWFVLVDRYGLMLAPPRSVLAEYEVATYIRHMAFNAFRELLSPSRLPSLSVYASWDAFCRGDQPLAPDASVSALGSTEKSALVVVAPVAKSALPAEPSTPRYGTNIPMPTEDVVWLGSRRGAEINSRGIEIGTGGFDFADLKLLPRPELTHQVIKMLDETHVVQVVSPPMTGKSSLAVQVCRDLHNRGIRQQQQQPQRVAIANMSMCTVDFDEPFRNVFLRLCGIDWDQFLALRDRGYLIYLVVDDCQWLYNIGSDGPQRGSLDLWKLIEQVLVDANVDVRVLLLGCHANSLLVPPIQVPSNQQLRAESLLFNEDELHEYVSRWFAGVASLDQAMPEFCALLLTLTGGHVGFCAYAIRALNDMFAMRIRRFCPPPTANEWIDAIQFDGLDNRRLVGPFDMEVTFHIFHVIDRDPEARFGRLLDDPRVYDDSRNEAFLRHCVDAGILVDRGDGHVHFFMPLMWRLAVKHCVRRLPRATDAPATLTELMLRVQREMDYTGVRETLRRAPHDALAVDRAWQWALYEAVYRSTPPRFWTSVDDGLLFGSPEVLTLMVRHGKTRWGIELLRDARHWRELVARFAPGGRYAQHGLSESCVVRFDGTVATDDARSGDTAEGVGMRWAMLGGLELSFAALVIGEAP